MLYKNKYDKKCREKLLCVCKSKYGKVGFVKIANFSDIDCVITEKRNS